VDISLVADLVLFILFQRLHNYHLIVHTLVKACIYVTFHCFLQYLTPFELIRLSFLVF